MVLRLLKRLITLVLLGAVAFGLYVSMKQKPIPVDIATIDRGTIEVTISEDGRTRIRDVYQVFAPIAGRIDRSAIEVGDEIIKDSTVIAEIHSVQPPFQDLRTRREIEAHVEAMAHASRLAEAELRSAMAAYRLSKSEFQRVEQLHQRAVVSEQRFEIARTEMENHRAAMEKAAANLRMQRSERESAAAKLMQPQQDTTVHGSGCCVVVHAPHQGVALSIPTESEHFIAQGTLIAEIGDPNDLEIVVDLLSSDAVQIAVGDEARVLGWGGKEALLAQVHQIDPVGFTKTSALGIEEQRVNVVLNFTSPPETYLRLDHDFRVQVEIIVTEVNDAIRVPLGALFRDRNEWAVFRIVDENSTLTPIALGERNDRYAEVISGLGDADQVILYPSDRIEDGFSIIDRNGPKTDSGVSETLRDLWTQIETFYGGLSSTSVPSSEISSE